jgi:hypothetical protein
MSGSTPRRARPAQVRYYFDANVLGLAKVVSTLRPDVTYPGDPGGEGGQECAGQAHQQPREPVKEALQNRFLTGQSGGAGISQVAAQPGQVLVMLL